MQAEPSKTALLTDEAIQRLYDEDGDSKRTSHRYFAGPEDYVASFLRYHATENRESLRITLANEIAQSGGNEWYAADRVLDALLGPRRE